MIKTWKKMESVPEQREEPAKFNKNRVSIRVLHTSITEHLYLMMCLIKGLVCGATDDSAVKSTTCLRATCDTRRQYGFLCWFVDMVC